MHCYGLHCVAMILPTAAAGCSHATLEVISTKSLTSTTTRYITAGRCNIYHQLQHHTQQAAASRMCTTTRNTHHLASLPAVPSAAVVAVLSTAAVGARCQLQRSCSLLHGKQYTTGSIPALASAQHNKDLPFYASQLPHAAQQQMPG